MTEEAGDYWYQLIHSYADFEMDQALIDAVNNLDLTQWQQFYQSYFIAGNEASLLLVSNGKAKGANAKEVENYQLIDSIAEFKQDAESLVFK